MKHPQRAAALLALLFALFPAAAPAQEQAAWKLIAQVQREQQRVRDYTVDITALADIPGMKTPEMRATLYFKQPDMVQVKSDGFAMIPRDVLTLNASMLDPALFDAVIQGSESVDGVVCTKVRLLALSDTVRLQRATLYIDPAASVVRRLDTDPARGEKATVTITYKNVAGYRLPDRVVVEMDSPMGFRRGAAKSDAGEAKKARINLRYGTYAVNTGLDDALFKTTTTR